MVRQAGNILLRLRRADPYTLLGSAVSLVLVLVDDPWWSMHGANDSKLFTIQVSPYYLKTFATGLAQTVPFAGPLGLVTRIVLVMGFLSFVSVSVRPNAWWRDLASYFGMSALAELFFSFLLMLHAAETTLLGAYGSLPPFSGTGQLSGSIIGLDLAFHIQPLVTAGFSLPLFLGLGYCGFLGLGLIVKTKRKKKTMMGVGAIFTPDHEDESGLG
jgi:hypothetical protein